MKYKYLQFFFKYHLYTFLFRNPDKRDRPYPYRNFDTQEYLLKTPRTGLKPIRGASKDDRFGANIPPSKPGTLISNDLMSSEHS